jgi:hypothetical protein
MVHEAWKRRQLAHAPQHHADGARQPKGTAGIGFERPVVDEIHHRDPTVSIQIMQTWRDARLCREAHRVILMGIAQRTCLSFHAQDEPSIVVLHQVNQRP